MGAMPANSFTTVALYFNSFQTTRKVLSSPVSRLTHGQVGGAGAHPLFQQVTRLTQGVFGQRAVRDVLNAKHPANDLLAQILRA